MSIEFRGKLNTDAALKAARKGGQRGLALAGEHILGESNKRVPHDEGTLERSGTVSTEPSKLRAAVSYDTPYAVEQHEDLSLHYDNGREAKYLENAMNAESKTAGEIVTKAIQGEL